MLKCMMMPAKVQTATTTTDAGASDNNDNNDMPDVVTSW